MLKIKNLTKKFGSKTAVNSVSFNVNPGEIFCLIGPNGSGKTTIVKTVAGLLKPSGGEVIVNNYDTVAKPELAKSQIGYIPDEPVVWSSITGEEFLHIVGGLYNITEEERTRRIPELLNLFGLKGIEQEYFEDYSRGNKQKFSLLAALLHKPKILLVDEPIVGLDPTSAEIAKQQFTAFAKQGGAVLMVTHTLTVAQEIASRIGLLQNGHLKAIGTFSELKTKAKVGSNGSLENVYKNLTEKHV